MLNLKDLGFENIEEIEFFRPPTCNCEKCQGKEDARLSGVDGCTISEAVNSLLLDINCNASGALVLKKSELGVAFISRNRFLDEHEEDNTFLQLGPQESDTRETFIQKFVNLVNEYNLHKVVVLEETDEDGLYEFIY